MPSRRSDRHRRLRSLGVALLILGVGHVPWPRADYHNIRHHDGPGQVCPLHDHLLRWHPGASGADDVAVLHWHWMPPRAPLPDQGDGPTARAHAQDWPGATWDDGPRLAAPAPARWIGTLEAEPIAMAGPGPTAIALAAPPRAGPGAPRSFPATFTSRVPLTALLGHWNC